jgi:uncharacterized RDD family membrane protein YckC
MDQILDSPISTQRSLNYAGFWIRFGAYLMDGILLWVVQIMLAFIVFDGYNPMVPNYALSLISMVMGIVYFAAMESSERQATLGKMAVGIRVGNETGGRISFLNAVGRYFGKILSAIILLIGFMMAGWDDKKQALHDKLAGTYVFYMQ